MDKLIFKIDGMDCAEEIKLLKQALSPLLNGREELLTFDLINEKMILECQDDVPTEDAIINAVARTGMKAIPWHVHVKKTHQEKTFWQRSGHTTMATASALNLGAGFIYHSAKDGIISAFASGEERGQNYPIPSIAFYAAAIVTGGWFIFPKALRAARRLKPDMNLLMTTAVTGAAIINQWFEAAIVTFLFAASLLLESWNVNRARRAIRALVELTPPTARVTEKIINDPVNNRRYIQHSVTADGDCGYTSFGIAREDALQQLIEVLSSVKTILHPGISEALLMEDFYDYLCTNQAIAGNVSHEALIRNLDQYAADLNLLKWYLYYDIRDERIDAGWAHPCVLQALASVQGKELLMWHLNEHGELVPHRGEAYDYAVYTPPTVKGQLNLLFVNGNHFELLEPTEQERHNIRELRVEEISVGTVIVVRPGEKIPMDSVLVLGSTNVNQAPITGESMPVRKEIGDELFAGTINGDSAIQCRVTKAAADSTLARIIRMVEEAQSRRANSEQLVEKFARYYTPAMMLLALFIAAAMPLILDGSWNSWIYQGLVILVIACPCALVISTPISIVAGLNAAARSGVLIKGGMYLEAPAHIKVVAIDKTGTLTRGEPMVQKIIALNDHSEEDLLKLALSLETHSDHPLARAVQREAKSKGIATQPAENFQIVKGKGAEGYIGGELFWIGSHRFLHEKVGDREPTEIHQRAQELEDTGHSIVAIGHGQHICGLIGIADAVREESAGAMRALKQAGIQRIIMLTGDNNGTAKAIAESVGIDEYHAELLPENKVEQVQSLVARHKRVIMVGDGINDAPAMAASSLAVAMGAAGSDAAIETADIALMSDDLEKLAWLVKHSQRTQRIIKQNMAFSLAIKGLFIGLTFSGKSSLWMAIVADMGASFIVVFNGLRLLNNRLACQWRINESRATVQETDQAVARLQGLQRFNIFANRSQPPSLIPHGEQGHQRQWQMFRASRPSAVDRSAVKPCCGGCTRTNVIPV